jgi:hypothetical protein
MVASLNGKDAASIGENPLFDVFYPGPIHPDREIMLLLAGYSTGMTSDALAIVNDEAVIHCRN